MAYERTLYKIVVRVVGNDTEIDLHRDLLKDQAHSVLDAYVARHKFLHRRYGVVTIDNLALVVKVQHEGQ